MSRYFLASCLVLEATVWGWTNVGVHDVLLWRGGSVVDAMG